MIFDSPIFDSALTIAIGFLFLNSDLINYQSNFQVLFGIDATQDLSGLRIKKDNLSYLQPLTNNTAESLFVSLILKLVLLNSENNISFSGYFWGTNISNNIRNDIFVINLLNKLIPVDIYELPEPNNIFNPMDY
jgi:hypothetical protein